MTAYVGVDVNDWSLAELVAAAAEKGNRERERHRLQWCDWSVALAWIINAMPMRCEGWRPVEADQINPYRAAKFVRGTPLRRGDPESKSALRAFVDRVNEATRR